MGSRKDVRRAAKKHAKAVKRRQKLAARPPSVATPAPIPAVVPRAPLAPRRARELSVWDPAAPPWNVGRPPPLRTMPGPGPHLLAARFADRWLAIHRRSDDGSTALVPLADLPVDHEVAWAGEPQPIRMAEPHEVAWAEEPVLVDGGVRGALTVHALVSGEEGLVWSPKVAVEVDADGRVHAEVCGGDLGGDGPRIDWGTDDTHAAAVADFLEAQHPLLWRILHGGPGIDAEWRVRAIRGPSSGYRRWALDDLVRHGDEVVPHLVAILEEVARGARDPSDDGPLYALAALAHLRAREAHPVLLALARLDANDFEDVFGAFMTEAFDAALLTTAGGDLDGVRALLLDRAADAWLRGEAADALVAAVELGQASREEVIELLSSLLTPDADDDPDSPLWGSIGGALLDLRAVEVEARLVEACDSGLVDPLDFDAAWVRRRLHDDEEQQPNRCAALARSEDVHAWIGWWTSFQSPAD